jgi:hypothetical protein
LKAVKPLRFEHSRSVQAATRLGKIEGDALAQRVRREALQRLQQLGSTLKLHMLAALNGEAGGGSRYTSKRKQDKP